MCNDYVYKSVRNDYVLQRQDVVKIVNVVECRFFSRFDGFENETRDGRVLFPRWELKMTSRG